MNTRNDRNAGGRPTQPPRSLHFPVLAAGRPSRPVSRLIWPGLAVVVFGLLLWARFLLVTGHPRTAVADPPATNNAHAAAGAAEHP